MKKNYRNRPRHTIRTKDEKNNIIKQKNENIYKYENIYGKKMKITDLFKFKKYIINIKKWAIYFNEIKKEIEDDYSISDNDVALWYYFFPKKTKAKNYLKYSNIEMMNIDLPADIEDLKKYKIMSITIENYENSVKYTFDEEDTQLALLLAEQKTAALWHCHDRKLDYVLISGKKIEAENTNFLEMFEILNNKKENSFSLIFEEDGEYPNHAYIVSYPIFNGEDTLTIIKKE